MTDGNDPGDLGYLDDYMIDAVAKSDEDDAPFHSYLEFASLMEASEGERMDYYAIIGNFTNMNINRPPSKERKEGIARLVEIAESAARLFMCCEIAIAENMRDRISTLPNNSASRTLLLQLTRAASYLRVTSFHAGPFVGEGQYGAVYVTRTEFSPKLYALKIVRIDIPQRIDKVRIYRYMRNQVSALRERDAMLMADHPFICKLRASWVEKMLKGSLHYLFLMEYAPFGTLRDFIRKVFHKLMQANLLYLSDAQVIERIERSRKNQGGENKPLDPAVRKKIIYIYATELACALEYLHRLNIVHRDFKPPNVLIGEDYHLRVTDFGFVNPKMAYHSYMLHDVTSAERDQGLLSDQPTDIKEVGDPRLLGTTYYTGAPEIYSNEVLETTKHFPIDMWSLGISLFELYCRVHPLYEADPYEDKISKYQQFRVLSEPLYSMLIDDEYYRNVLSRLICDMKDRLTSKDAVEILNKMVVQLTGKGIEEIAKTRLDLMVGVVQRQLPETLDFDSWVLPPMSPYSPQGAPAVMKTFPYIADSPSLSQ